MQFRMKADKASRRRYASAVMQGCFAEAALRILFATLSVASILALSVRIAYAEKDASASGHTPVSVQTVSAKNTGSASQSELTITGWQGAKNYHDCFNINVGGGYAGGSLRFLASNCTVSPSTGTVDDTYTVTVTGAGTYSMTAIMVGNTEHGEISESRSGVAGKADQEPLSIVGWGNSRDYYRTFTIQVSGGTTNGTVRFQADGCSVSPTTGNVNSVFTVTVTRVGTYSLTAIMDGNGNYSEAHSAQCTGMSGKADQASIMIDGWVSNSCFGSSFPLSIAGGSTNETLNIVASGCEVVKESGHNYTVTITSVGPYSVTASRAGNYGYNAESASVCGVSKRAAQPSLSISGWVENKNVADSFGIRVSGGMPDGTINFATIGCTIVPSSGTTETSYVVTVDTVGTYSLTAFIDADDAHMEASSRELTGTAGKAVQPSLEIQNWNDNAAQNSTFDITVLGGSGTGALSITTDQGCVATRSNGDESVYTVNVVAASGAPYSLTIEKAGDANYGSAALETYRGVAGQAAQVELNINGWKETSSAGDEFAIQIAGGSGDGIISFEAVGCKVSPESGDIDDVYQVVITATEGEPYSLAIKRNGSGIYASTSTLRSGNVSPASAAAIRTEDAEQHDEEVPLLGDGFDIWVLIGLLSIMTVLVAIALVLQKQRRRPSRRYR